MARESNRVNGVNPTNGGEGLVVSYTFEGQAGGVAPGGSRRGQRPSLDQALHESEIHSHALLSIVSDFIFIARKDGEIVHVQSCRSTEFVLPAEAVVGQRVMGLLPTQIGQQAMHYLEKTLRTRATQFFCCQHLLPGGLRDFEIRTAVWGPGEVVALVRDVTERKILEKELLEITQRERTRIGQDLHDGLGQHLTGISFLSKALQKKLMAKGVSEAAEAAEIGTLVMQALSQTRNIARGLFPVEVEETGIYAAFKELAATAEQLFEISCQLECEEGLEIRNEAAATQLFRLAQEAISNSVKHGKAKSVVITLGREDGEGELIGLTIVDDGVGFGQSATSHNGLGLRIMKFRAQKLGGRLEVGSGPTGGAVVRCVFQDQAR